MNGQQLCVALHEARDCDHGRFLTVKGMIARPTPGHSAALAICTFYVIIHIKSTVIAIYSKDRTVFRKPLQYIKSSCIKAFFICSVIILPTCTAIGESQVYTVP